MHVEVTRALAPLRGLPLRALGRAGDLLWLAFGEMRESLSPLGKLRTIGEWALHLECPWRVCQGGHLIVASGDMYYGPSDEALDDWDAPGQSRCDAATALLCDGFSTSPPSVTAIEVDEVGGFTLVLTNDYRVDVFPARSNANSEHWRLFQPGVGQASIL